MTYSTVECGAVWAMKSALPALGLEIGQGLPLISVVTPSFNQAKYIEATLRSVIAQNYPRLEYVVVDGGSTDGSKEIVEQYMPWISRFFCEPDNGQADALNKGFACCNGDVMCWVNSDDVLAPGTLHRIAKLYRGGCQWWTGEVGVIDGLQNDAIVPKSIHDLKHISLGELIHARVIIHQLCTFWTKDLWLTSGAKVNDYHLAMDYELWLRFAERQPTEFIPACLGFLRKHADAKTGLDQGMNRYLKECDQVRDRWYESRRWHPLVKKLAILCVSRYALVRREGWKGLCRNRPIPWL